MRGLLDGGGDPALGARELAGSGCGRLGRWGLGERGQVGARQRLLQILIVEVRDVVLVAAVRLHLLGVLLLGRHGHDPLPRQHRDDGVPLQVLVLGVLAVLHGRVVAHRGRAILKQRGLSVAGGQGQHRAHGAAERRAGARAPARPACRTEGENSSASPRRPRAGVGGAPGGACCPFGSAWKTRWFSAPGGARRRAPPPGPTRPPRTWPRPRAPAPQPGRLHCGTPRPPAAAAAVRTAAGGARAPSEVAGGRGGGDPSLDTARGPDPGRGSSGAAGGSEAQAYPAGGGDSCAPRPPSAMRAAARARGPGARQGSAGLALVVGGGGGGSGASVQGSAGAAAPPPAGRLRRRRAPVPAPAPARTSEASLSGTRARARGPGAGPGWPAPAWEPGRCGPQRQPPRTVRAGMRPQARAPLLAAPHLGPGLGRWRRVLAAPAPPRLSGPPLPHRSPPALRRRASSRPAA